MACTRAARRALILSVLAIGAVLIAIPARAQQSSDSRPTPSNITRAGAWMLGDRLGLAALLYDQGDRPEMAEETLASARRMASNLGVEIRPFPARAAKSSETTAAVVAYLLRGGAAQTGADIGKAYGKDHEALFEVASKSKLLFRLYGPGEDLGKSMAAMIQSRMTEIGVPQPVWNDVVVAIRTNQPSAAVRDAVSRMGQNIGKHYFPDKG